MQDYSAILDQLVHMPKRDYSSLIQRVDEKRREIVEEQEGDAPSLGIDRDAFARWIGLRHFNIDKGISQVIYLPHNAPDNEVRLLEVNVLTPVPDSESVEAIDFTPDISSIDYKVYVSEITPGEFEAFKKSKLGLPKGWSEVDSRIIVGDA